MLVYQRVFDSNSTVFIPILGNQPRVIQMDCRSLKLSRSVQCRL